MPHSVSTGGHPFNDTALQPAVLISIKKRFLYVIGK